MPSRAHGNTDKALILKYSQGLIRISCAAVWMLHASILAKVAWFVHSQSNDGVPFSCTANFGCGLRKHWRVIFRNQAI